ncbi:1-phosphatidylinositol 3-phosphate 5-kinase FAB1 [Phytophthora ramorum]|uniref:1-phosphatidylinositol 3-phosphate 5-kinase FAB1 n=1 Tax=Phytophthora ramorum TaxID=164328 RepID=UPI0030A9E526|nr:1-phosphatidylinositol 3-phosphate 5-kinase FAB1 [Phytophthora ramorum]
MLEFPLHDGFFPQIALSREEVKYYKRLGKERVAQLVRIIEDADCAYKWTNASSSSSRRLRLEPKSGVTCQRANFLDFQPANKAAHASTLLKASVQLSDTRVDEILRAIAKVKTKDLRKTLRYMHGDAFVDGRTLFTFPTSSAATGSETSHSRAKSSYRAIKWHAFKTQRPRHGEEQKILDFCYLEYAGKKKPHPGSNVVAFCVQESISRDREVPTLENFGVARGYLSRMGLIVSQTHQPNTFRVTSICQIDGDLNPIVRNVLEELMKQTVCAVAQIPGLVARQRVSSLRFVEQWQWVPNSDRKACAVCLRGFYFRRKHHCRTCGEVVCSSCALLRELEEPIFDISRLRVCSACMTSAGARQQLSALSATGDEPVSSSNDTESYIRGLRSPQHNSYEDMVFHMRESRDRDRRQSDLAMDVLESSDTELKPVAQKCKSPNLRNQDKLQALTDVVTHIREVRETINLTMSEAAYAENDSGEEEFNDMYSEITSIREALESSVSNFDAALANTTNAAPAMYYSGPSDRSQNSLHSEQDDMTPDQFISVARITFAAARATSQAGQAFLSTFSDTGPELLRENDENSVASYPTIYDSDDSLAQSPDPYSASNYEKLMATYEPEHDESEQEEETHKFPTSVRRATEIHELEKKIRDLQRSLEDAQRKLSVIDSDEPEPEARSRRLDAVQERSAQVEIESVFEIFGTREETNADAASSVSSGPRAMSLPSDAMGGSRLTTQDLVLELRGVMASSETPVRTSGGSRKSMLRSASPPLPAKAPISPPPPPPASPPLASGKKLVPSNHKVGPSVSKPTTSKAGSSNGGLNDSHGSTQKNQHRRTPGPNRPSVTPSEGSYLQGLGTTGGTRYDDDYASSSDEESYDDSSDDLSLLSSDDFREPQFKKYQGPDAFFVEEDLGALLKKRKGTSPSIDPAASPTSPLPPAPAVGRDERDELRELMAGLVRPRSSSLPFQSGQMGGASSGEPLQDYGKPSWSDDAPDRIPTAHQVEEAVREIRACLASCRCECPSDTERARKLTSIFKVLRSLHREGVRSKFRTLQHDDIRYSKMLKATPSIIKLLKLAGYVSLQQKLTMRRVDQDYLALFLRELEHELHSSTAA